MTAYEMRISDWSSDVCSSDLYDTPDGTCLRDFIHVSDLARAHVSALDYLAGHRESLTLNCGYGRGYSVREVLDAIQRIAGRPLVIRTAPRRPGDVGAVIADASRLRAVFDWVPEQDRKSVVEGKSVSGRVDLGG